MISFKVACNKLIVETISRPAHTEARLTDMLTFKEACNPPGKMVVLTTGSGGPRGYMGVWNGPRCNKNFPK